MKTKIKRSDWLEDDFAWVAMSGARQWRQAYRMARIHRCPKPYLRFCREEMRACAIEGLRCVRKHVNRRASLAAA